MKFSYKDVTHVRDVTPPLRHILEGTLKTIGGVVIYPLVDHKGSTLPIDDPKPRVNTHYKKIAKGVYLVSDKEVSTLIVSSVAGAVCIHSIGVSGGMPDPLKKQSICHFKNMCDLTQSNTLRM